MFVNLKLKIQQNLVFDCNYLKSLNYEEIETLREDSVFNDQWARVYEKVQSLQIPQIVSNQIEEIYECVYDIIMQATNDTKISVYVAEDFEMMCRAYFTNFEDEWLSRFANKYVQKKIPYGDLGSENFGFSAQFELLV